MKKRILLFTLIGISFGIKAQNTFPTTGNVGIGTINPLSILHVLGSGTGAKGITIQNNVEQMGNSAALWFKNAAANSKYRKGSLMFVNDGRGYGRGDFIFALNNSASSASAKYSDTKMIIKSETGNVGIGTTSPSTKLHIIGNENSNWVSTISNTATFGHSIYTGYNNGAVTYGLFINGGKTTMNDIDFAVENKFYIKGDGNVGIGITNPDAKLAVNGKIHTKEVKIDLIGWSDFVFENDYKLPTLKDVEKHIKEKGHLKDIPSAKEVEKNGIHLGEMNSKLLQKIEELTLYAIAQEKKIEKVENENKSLYTNFLELRKRLEKLEKK